MSVKEVRQALGNWGITLEPSTPREVLAEIEANKFGHIAILPGRINPLQYGDGLLRQARYVGVYRSTFKQSDDTVNIKGVGMAFWLGDEDDKGDVFETPVVLTNATFPNSIRALLPPGGAVKEGTLYSVPGTYTNKHVYETPRKAITYVTDTYSTGDDIVEFRVNGDATLDAGPIANLYKMTPSAILVKKDTGRDMRLLGLRADMSMDYDVEDLTTRIVLLAQGEGTTIPTATADAVPTGWKDLFGSPIKMTRLVSESGTPVGNAATRAELQLRRWSMPRQAIQIRTDEFDIKGDFVVGDYIYVFDPESGFYDLDNEVFWKGQPINPIALRVTEMDWGIRPNWTVAFRKNDGTWMDLSEYYKSEGGSATLAVGDYRRTLAGNNYEPLGFRPNLPPPGADNTIPAAPVFTGFSTGSYEADDRTLAAILAQWSEPLNLDGSTIQDGDHYEIRYRPNAIIGTSTPWDYLSGGYAVDYEDDFNTPATNGFGAGWASIGGSTNQSVAGGEAQISHTTFNTLWGQVRIAPTYTDVEILSSNMIDYYPSGGSTVMGVVKRVDANNTYWVRVEPNVDLSVTLKITRYKAGIFSELKAMTVPGITHEPGVEVWSLVTIIGNVISAKIWQGTRDDEPERDTTSVIDTDPIVGAGQVGFWDYIVSASTNPLGSITRHSYLRARSLTPDNVANAYSWDDLGTWDSLTSEPVATTPNWTTAYTGWDQNAVTLTELGPGLQYELQIRAVDSANPPHNSAWSASSFVNTTGDTIAPSTPAAPEVAASMIAVQVIHNLGKSSGGVFNLENDLDHFDVHASSGSNFLPEAANKIGELVATGAMVRGNIPAVGTFKVDQASTVWIRVVAVDRTGNRSAASQAVQSSIVLIDDAHISDLTVSKVTAGTISAQWLMAGSIRTATTGARVEMTSAGFNAYNGSGVKTVEIKSSDGSATFTGELQTELNDVGIRFFTSGNNAFGYWSINDAAGNSLDHRFRQVAYDAGGFFGQSFEETIRRKSDGVQDGGKLMMSQASTIISHQPASGPEAYLSLGAYPGGGAGRIYARGKFERAWVQDSNGAIWTQVQVVGAGFSGQVQVYGPTMSEFMCVNATIVGSVGDSCVLTASTATGHTVSWTGTAGHSVYVWAVRVESS